MAQAKPLPRFLPGGPGVRVRIPREDGGREGAGEMRDTFREGTRNNGYFPASEHVAEASYVQYSPR